MIYFLAAAVIVTAIAAVADLRTGEMPNWLTIGPILIAPIARVVVALAMHKSGHDALSEGGSSILGVMACVVVPGFLYRWDAIGGGDVKLLASVGAILGWRMGIQSELYSFFAAGLIAPAFLAYEGKLFRTLTNAVLLGLNPLLPKRKRRPIEPTLLTWFRFGPAIFLGTGLTAYFNWRQ